MQVSSAYSLCPSHVICRVFTRSNNEEEQNKVFNLGSRHLRFLPSLAILEMIQNPEPGNPNGVSISRVRNRGVLRFVTLAISL